MPFPDLTVRKKVVVGRQLINSRRRKRHLSSLTFATSSIVGIAGSNKVFVRLIIGGQDGSVTFLVVAHNSLEQRETTRNALRKLPSRKWQKRHHPGSLEEEPDKEGSQDDPSSSHLLSRELEERRLYKQRVLRRFRWVKRNNWSPKLVKRKRIKRKIYCNSSVVKSEIYLKSNFALRSDCIQANFANTLSWTHAINCENCNSQISQTKRFCQHLAKGNPSDTFMVQYYKMGRLLFGCWDKITVFENGREKVALKITMFEKRSLFTFEQLFCTFSAVCLHFQLFVYFLKDCFSF